MTTAERRPAAQPLRSRRRWRCLPALICAAFLATAPAPVAFAQDKVAAEALFQEGKRLMNEGKFDQACPKFVESQKQDPSPGTLLNLGRCHEGLGKTATAWAEYKEAAAMARSMGRAEQESAANERATAIEPKLSKLKIELPPQETPGMVVKRNGAAVGVGSLGVALPVDPGEQVIEASAQGYRPWSTKIAVGANGDQKSVALPVLEKDPLAAATPSPAGGEPSSAIGTTTPDVTTDDGKTRRIIGFVVGGAGVAFIGVGAVFGLLAAGQAGDAEDSAELCPDKQCTKAGRDEIDGAETKALVSTIGFGVGAAAIVAGVVLIATSGSSKSTGQGQRAGARTARVLPAVGPTGGGLTVMSRF